jgi:signal transduction histidine kinase
LAVQDDGCGFDPAAKVDHPSLGLESTRERVRLLDGEFEIESAPNEGTTILAWVPVKTTAATAAGPPNELLETSAESR